MSTIGPLIYLVEEKGVNPDRVKRVLSSEALSREQRRNLAYQWLRWRNVEVTASRIEELISPTTSPYSPPITFKIPELVGRRTWLQTLWLYTLVGMGVLIVEGTYRGGKFEGPSE